MSGRLHASATLPLGRDACTRVIGGWGCRTPGVVMMLYRGMDTALLQLDWHTAVFVCSINMTTKITGPCSVLAEHDSQYGRQFAANLPTKPFGKPFTSAPTLTAVCCCRLGGASELSSVAVLLPVAGRLLLCGSELAVRNWLTGVA